MVSYTQISQLPYPAMSDPPNGPDQIAQLARTLEPRITNRFKTAADRNARITAPSLGMLTFRDDSKSYEYWDGSAWVGATQNVAVASTSTVSSGTNRNFTTTESPTLVKTSVKIVNPSSIYRMMWTAFPTCHLEYSWSAKALEATTRHFTRVDAGADDHDAYQLFTTDGTAINFTNTSPPKAGFIAAGGNVTISTWLTVQKTNATTGTITLTSAYTELLVTGVTTT